MARLDVELGFESAGETYANFLGIGAKKKQRALEAQRAAEEAARIAAEQEKEAALKLLREKEAAEAAAAKAKLEAEAAAKAKAEAEAKAAAAAVAASAGAAGASPTSTAVVSKDNSAAASAPALPALGDKKTLILGAVGIVAALTIVGVMVRRSN